MNLALEGTEKGKLTAAQALSRIAITMNPEVAFPGQRVNKLYWLLICKILEFILLVAYVGKQ